MKVHIKERPWDLAVIVILTTLLLLAIMLIPDSPMRTILGLPYILFFPGYVLISALFPEEEPLDKIERIALSFGLSIAITPLIGLLLNYIWEISLTPIMVSLSLFIFAFSAVAAYKRYSIPGEERFHIYLEVHPPNWEEYDIIDKALVIATVGLLIASGGLAYHIATTPRTGERFTEFYVLGPDGMADDYPTNVTVNESGHVILGAVNREHRDMDYVLGIRAASTNLNTTEELENNVESSGDNESLDVEINFDRQNMTVEELPESRNMSLSPDTTYVTNFTLDHDKKYLEHMNYSIDDDGLYFVQFVLIKQGEDLGGTKPYRELHLWVTVREG